MAHGELNLHIGDVIELWPYYYGSIDKGTIGTIVGFCQGCSTDAEFYVIEDHRKIRSQIFPYMVKRKLSSEEEFKWRMES